MKKTNKVLLSLQFIDELDLSSQELERLIDELDSIQEQKENEEGQNFIDNEEDKQNSLNQLNYM